uniref:Uncharacterized protein n=1 Tax=Hyaloperonospora arabidopsidis (strain Emoy2) TaxID=559515 RepID=M4BX02_HYAAE
MLLRRAALRHPLPRLSRLSSIPASQAIVEERTKGDEKWIRLMQQTSRLESSVLLPLNEKLLGPLDRKHSEEKLPSLPFVFLLGNHSSVHRRSAYRRWLHDYCSGTRRSGSRWTGARGRPRSGLLWSSDLWTSADPAHAAQGPQGDPGQFYARGQSRHDRLAAQSVAPVAAGELRKYSK